MMSPRRYILLILALLMIGLGPFFLLGSQMGEALPDGYPISLSGGYSEEVQGTTTYVDYLQPGDTENYLLRLENNDPLEVRYRVTISGIPDGWLVFLDNGNQNMPVDLEAFGTESIYIYIKNPKVGTADILINVTDEGTEEFWTITLRVICQKGPILVDVEGSNFILGRDVPSVFEVDIENIGEVVLNVTLDMVGIVPSDVVIADIWTVKFSERTFLIPPFATKTIIAKVYAPQFEPIGSQKVSNLDVNVNGITRPFSSQSLTFRVQTIFDLRASVTPIGYQKINPGSSVEFDLKLENLASATDYILISEYSTPSGWNVGFNDSFDPTSFSVSIDPESSRRFNPVVFVPPSAIAGKHEVVMRASGTSNVTEFKLLVEVARKDNVVGYATPQSGQGSTYRMTLGSNLIGFEMKNNGNAVDLVTLEIENRPAWAPFKFHSVKVGDGTVENDVSGADVLNLSGVFNGEFTFTGSDLDLIKVSLLPSQSIRVFLTADVSMEADPERGVVGIKFNYGQFNKQSFLQLSLKLVIVDLEIEDLNSDGIPDLLLYPRPDYEYNDRIHFTFTLRNNYPFATREGDVEWRIELAGTVLLKGDVGMIPPGNEKEFNVSWKADKSTNDYYFAYLRLSGSVYEDQTQAPSAKSEDEISISSGVVSRSWGFMVMFFGIMAFIIILFIALFMIAQRNKQEREMAARAKYDEVYGGKRPPGLGMKRTRDLPGGEGDRRALPRKVRPGLPSPRDRDGETDKKKKEPSASSEKEMEPPKRKKIEEDGDRPKKAPSLKEMEIVEDS